MRKDGESDIRLQEALGTGALFIGSGDGRELMQDPPDRPPVPEYLCFIYAPRNDAERQVIETLLDAAIWFATGYDPKTKESFEDELKPLQPPAARTEKRSREEISTPEYLSELFDWCSDFAWRWIIRLGSGLLVIWIMELHTVLFRFSIYTYWGWIMYRFDLENFPLQRICDGDLIIEDEFF